MRKRSGGGGGGGGRGPLSQTLYRHIKTFDGVNISSNEQIVEYLQYRYPHHYSPSRTKAKTLLTQVRAALARIKRHEAKPLISDDEDEDEDEDDSSRKKKPRRAAEDAEERLRRLEEERLRRINRRLSDSEDDEGGVSTSEDAVYGEKLPPRVDLLKMQLRDSNKKAAAAAETKNVELEIPGREKKPAAAELSLGGGGKASSFSGGGAPVGRGGDGDGPWFKDLGGMKEVLKELAMEVMVPLHHGKLLRWLGVQPISGILLSGPPGCGKTRLAHAIANEAGLPFYKISATEVVSGVSGASEENLRDLFSKAQRTAPSIVFIDEIDAIGAKREGLQREMERRIVTQLLTCMDESHRPSKLTDLNSNPESTDSEPGYVLVIGATNRPDALDPALRRPGRFDREIVLGVPDENARVEILSVFTKSLRLEGSFDLQNIAKSTPGFVGADLKALVNKAGNLAMRRIVGEIKSKATEGCADDEEVDTKWWKEPLLPEEMEKLAITMQDFEEAVDLVQPSSKREGFSAIPNVKWEDVGGLNELRQEFDRYIVRRIKHPKEYEGFGVDLETGFLLYGPPGCGKTLIAKAVANESGANFIHIKGPELLSKFVGDSELAVRTLFNRARTCAPCVLFFDEVDALTTRRGSEGGWVVERLLNQLLIELDGAEQRRGVFVIGATNRPDVMDKALIRPGRFGKQLYVPLPTPLERGLILRAVARKKPVDSSVDFNAVAQMEACEHFSGADLAALANEAAMAALEENLMSMRSNPGGVPCTIKTTHFEKAAARIKPSVTIEQRHDYKKLLSKIIGA